MTRILAHRGASADFPENTALAFREALATQGADGFECDVHLSADGVPYVFHDDDTERLTGVPGDFERLGAQTIDGLRVRGERIPTLDLVVRLFLSQRARPLPHVLNVEIKPTGRPLDVVRACRPCLDPLAEGPAPPLVVSSFDPRVLRAAIDEGVPWRLALLYDDLYALSALRHLEDAPQGPLDLHPRHDLLDEAHLSEHTRAGRVFRVWTVDEPAEARRLLSLSTPPAGIVTNTPAVLISALAR